ncbi:hypothetical protein GCM10023330_01210 [Litoribaculum gwangyangense]|uniref:Uncharacterized protein n=1 Tax=Litoribaculum gwangyangense TaxID=1130722 RepID=A0ABP9BSS4_9FLAO
MLCTKIIMNPNDKQEIKTPEKGKVVSKEEYNLLISEKMEEYRNNRVRNGINPR